MIRTCLNAITGSLVRTNWATPEPPHAPFAVTVTATAATAHFFIPPTVQDRGEIETGDYMSIRENRHTGHRRALTIAWTRRANVPAGSIALIIPLELDRELRVS